MGHCIGRQPSQNFPIHQTMRTTPRISSSQALIGVKPDSRAAMPHKFKLTLTRSRAPITLLNWRALKSPLRFHSSKARQVRPGGARSYRVTLPTLTCIKASRAAPAPVYRCNFARATGGSNTATVCLRCGQNFDSCRCRAGHRGEA